ncbi:hypothetical protein [Filimonas effusa]|uniref:Uncharacterized protein n=1 Tax=Filimonas effusa TaxID=2508721 RepID=A0A4Q1D1X6_9BACT|nr:hypothetical protein [Filimonas effusa]RXK81015.1 hypothetical protein ESB13_22955 [Filimonas effusa]
MIQLHTRTGLLKRISVALFLVIATVLTSKAQLKVGDNPTTITKSAVLELESQRQGFLLPRLSDTTLINGYNPPDGMLIYLQSGTGTNRGLYLRKSGQWQRVTTDSTNNRSWSLNGNVVSPGDSLGSTNAADVIFIANSVERMRLRSGGAVAFSDSVYIGNRLTVKDSISSSIIRALDTVIARNARINDSLYLNPQLIQSSFNDVLVINPTTGAVSKRTLDTAAFKGLVVGNFSEAGNAQGLERKAGATNAPDTLILHAATFTTPGGLSTTAQNIAGTKTFRDSVYIGSGTGAGTPNSTLQVNGSVSYAINTVTAAHTLSATDYTLLVNPSAGANIPISLPTMPDASIKGRVYIIKKIGTTDIDASVTIAGNIEGLSSGSYVIYNTGTFVKMQTDGTSWYIIER